MKRKIKNLAHKVKNKIKKSNKKHKKELTEDQIFPESEHNFVHHEENEPAEEETDSIYTPHQKKKSFFKSKKFLIPLGLIVLIAGYTLLKGEEEAEFAIEKVVKGDVKQIVSVNGTVESNKKIELQFEKNGKIENISVKTGDHVEEGTLLANLENKTISFDVDKALAALNLAKADLNLLYAGPSPEEIQISEASVKEAETNLNNSKKELENTKLLNKEKLIKAELQVGNAEQDVENAQTNFENAKNSGQSSEEIAEESLENSYQDAEPAIISAIDTIKESITAADKVLGIDNKNINDEYEDFLGIKTPGSLSIAESEYANAKTEIKEIEDQYSQIKFTWERELVDDLLKKTDDTLDTVKYMLDQTYRTLEGALTGNDFSQAELESLKSEIYAKQTDLTSDITTINSILQAITNAKLGLTSTGLSITSDVDKAEAALDDAINALELANRNLEETKINNQIAENNAEMQIDYNEVLLEKAHASHANLIAPPRWVDAASLQARVDQASASYNQSLQALEDTKIYAPSQGVITNINGEIGETVSTALTTRFNIFEMMTDQLQITANVSETDITKIEIGDTAEITLDAFPSDRIFQGKVIDIDPAETVIQGVIYYEVKVIFESDEPKIKSGMTANIDILTDIKEDVLTITPLALNYENGDTFVQIFENGQMSKRYIKLGIEGDKAVEITEGLKEGEEVILYEK